MNGTWPDLVAYNGAVQNPRLCFSDPDLKTGQIKRKENGMPLVMSGNFATVYQIYNEDRAWAIRCFQRPVTDQEYRYAQTSGHLRQRLPANFVRYEYLPDGIRVGGARFPLVKMDWVEGLLLSTYLQEHRKNPQRIEELIAKWRGLMLTLKANQIAHGDLQYGNVIVTPQGDIKLVDYDAMYVPSLEGAGCPELGHINFQHPQRHQDYYDLRLDDFSALVIYVSLKALLVDPGLWERYHTGENLILTGEDFKNPDISSLFRELQRSPSEEVALLARRLVLTCRRPLSEIPNFDDLASEISAIAGSGRLRSAEPSPTGPLPDRGPKPVTPPPPPTRPERRKVEILTPPVTDGRREGDARMERPILTPAFRSEREVSRQPETPPQREAVSPWRVITLLFVLAALVGVYGLVRSQLITPQTAPPPSVEQAGAKVSVSICSSSGMRAGKFCAELAEVKSQSFAPGTQPTEQCTEHFAKCPISGCKTFRTQEDVAQNRVVCTQHGEHIVDTQGHTL